MKKRPKPIDLGEYKCEPWRCDTSLFNRKRISERGPMPCLFEKGTWVDAWISSLKSLETFNKIICKSGDQTFLVLLWWPDLFQRHQTNLLVTGKMFLRKLKETFERIGIQKQSVLMLLDLSSVWIRNYHNMKEEYDKLGIIFTDTDSALKEHPELFKKYFSKTSSANR